MKHYWDALGWKQASVYLCMALLHLSFLLRRCILAGVCYWKQVPNSICICFSDQKTFIKFGDKNSGNVLLWQQWGWPEFLIHLQWGHFPRLGWLPISFFFFFTSSPINRSSFIPDLIMNIKSHNKLALGLQRFVAKLAKQITPESQNLLPKHIRN